MKIIIAGNGKVGFTLAEQLSQEDHDVTILDTRDEALKRASDMLDVMCIKGNGATMSALKEAGADRANVVIAATSQDEVNMICCLAAKRLGAEYAIARVRSVEYARDLALIKRELGIDMVINPENATAVEIARLLRFPSAANIDTFYRGRVELMGFRLQEGDFLVGQHLYALPFEVKKLSLLFCAVERDGEVTIPNGAFVPQAGDKLYMVGRPNSLDRFFHLLGRYAPKIKQVFLLGGGKVSAYLAGILDHMGIRLKIIERSEERCRLISEQFPRVTVICGDGTDPELLESENLAASDAFIALTDRDEENLIISLYAMQQGISKVITKCNRQNYAGIVRSLGLDSVISPKFVTASNIVHVVRGLQNSKGSVMNSLHRIAGGGAEAMEFTVGPGTRYLGVPLKELKLRPGVLLAVIVRNNDIIIPEGSSFLQEGDRVIIIARGGGVLDLNDIYRSESIVGGAGA